MQDSLPVPLQICDMMEVGTIGVLFLTGVLLALVALLSVGPLRKGSKPILKVHSYFYFSVFLQEFLKYSYSYVPNKRVYSFIRYPRVL